jgi:hypothetical protein
MVYFVWYESNVRFIILKYLSKSIVNMINNPDWHKPKIKPYLHQISLDCIKKLVDCVEQFNKGKIDADTTFNMQRQILTDEIEDAEFLEFAITNFSEMMGYIAKGNLNIRIHRDITGKMWFGVGCE